MTTEQHVEGHKHAFIKGGHVVDVHVFDEASHDASIIEDVKNAFNHEEAVCLCWWLSQGNATEPAVHWSWDGTTFAPPTPQWLFANGYINDDPDAPVAAVETPAASTETTAPTA